jgi:hypothetical protein
MGPKRLLLFHGSEEATVVPWVRGGYCCSMGPKRLLLFHGSEEATVVPWVRGGYCCSMGPKRLLLFHGSEEATVYEQLSLAVSALLVFLPLHHFVCWAWKYASPACPVETRPFSYCAGLK